MTTPTHSRPVRGDVVLSDSICTRCGIDLESGAACALEGYQCLGSASEMDDDDEVQFLRTLATKDPRHDP